MKDTNPTPTAEEILTKHTKIKLREWGPSTDVLNAMNEHATLKTKPLELEIEGLKVLDKNKGETIQRLAGRLIELDSAYQAQLSALTVKADLLATLLDISLPIVIAFTAKNDFPIHPQHEKLISDITEVLTNYNK